MAQVTIRNLDDQVVSRLKAKAELAGKSLEEELRDILTREAPSTPEQKLAALDRFRALNPIPQTTDSTDLLREDRDNR